MTAQDSEGPGGPVTVARRGLDPGPSGLVTGTNLSPGAKVPLGSGCMLGRRPGLGTEAGRLRLPDGCPVPTGSAGPLAGLAARLSSHYNLSTS